MLTGPVVVLNQEHVPIQQRSLTGPAVMVDQVSLSELVARMKTGYSTITGVLAAAHDAWSAQMALLDPLDEQWRSTTSLAESLGHTPAALDRIRTELSEIRALVATDPLDSGPTVARLHRLSEQLTELRSQVDAQVALRDGYDARLQKLEEQFAGLQHTQNQARQARRLVLMKIVAPGLPEVDDATPGLRRRVDALQERYRAGLEDPAQWPPLAAELGEVELATVWAVRAAESVLTTFTGLLDRRSELRGRLDAYRAKATVLGHAEDAELSVLHREAHDLLFTPPCDLRAATRAVARYQQAVLRRSEEKPR